MRHQVELWLTVSKSDHWAIFSRHVQLPFPPFIGLQIIPYGNDAVDASTIKSVIWLNSENQFVCEVDGKEDIYEPWEDVKEFYFREGWAMTSEKPRTS